jgi:hypothetical protein
MLDGLGICERQIVNEWQTDRESLATTTIEGRGFESRPRYDSCLSFGAWLAASCGIMARGKLVITQTDGMSAFAKDMKQQLAPLLVPW